MQDGVEEKTKVSVRLVDEIEKGKQHEENEEADEEDPNVIEFNKAIIDQPIHSQRYAQ